MLMSENFESDASWLMGACLPLRWNSFGENEPNLWKREREEVTRNSSKLLISDRESSLSCDGINVE